MPKIVIFYWEPGSSGDFIVSLLLTQPSEYQGVTEKFSATPEGRIVPSAAQFFVENFTCDDNMWYLKKWSVDECHRITEYIRNLACEFFVIPTHQIDQVEILKSRFTGSVTLGITYPCNMFPLVLKNWCKKVAPTDRLISKVYNSPVHRYLRSKGSFGEFVLSEQLKYGISIKPFVDKKFDITIELEDLYRGDLSNINSLLKNNIHNDQQYVHWIEKQSKIHQTQFNIPSNLKQALGYNSKAQLVEDANLPLDVFDNILIKHQLNMSNIPQFNTLKQAADFLNNYNEST